MFRHPSKKPFNVAVATSGSLLSKSPCAEELVAGQLGGAYIYEANQRSLESTKCDSRHILHALLLLLFRRRVVNAYLFVLWYIG